MDTLRRMFRYNAWANRRVFAEAGALVQTLLVEEAKGTIGSLEETLKHLVWVEEIYFAMIRGQDLSALEPREAYYCHDLAWFEKRVDELGVAYHELLAHTDVATLERELVVPWLDVALTVHDGMVQVLVHSAQHRAQVFSTLGARRHSVPDLDYVEMLAEADQRG